MTTISRNFTTDAGRVVTLTAKQRFAQEIDVKSRELIYDVPEDTGDTGVTLTFMLADASASIFITTAALYGCAQRIKIATMHAESQTEIVEIIKQKFEEFTNGSFILRGVQEINLTGWQKAVMLAVAEQNPAKFAHWNLLTAETAAEFLNYWDNIWPKQVKRDFKYNPRINDIFDERFARKREEKVVELDMGLLFGASEESASASVEETV